MQTPSMVVCTKAGGLTNVRISMMSALFRASSAYVRTAAAQYGLVSRVSQGQTQGARCRHMLTGTRAPPCPDAGSPHLDCSLQGRQRRGQVRLCLVLERLRLHCARRNLGLLGCDDDSNGVGVSLFLGNLKDGAAAGAFTVISTAS